MVGVGFGGGGVRDIAFVCGGVDGSAVDAFVDEVFVGVGSVDDVFGLGVAVGAIEVTVVVDVETQVVAVAAHQLAWVSFRH